MQSRDEKCQIIKISAADKTLITTQQIGYGSTAFIYRGFLKGQPAAIKLAKNDADSIYTIQSEIEWLNEIFSGKYKNHPYLQYIVTYFGRSSNLNRPFFFMEFANGGNLTHWRNITHQLDFSWNMGFPIVVDITKALSFLHSINIIHCDVKPDNILIFEDNNKKITGKLADFGLAKHKIAGCDSTGTLIYSAPEILENEVIGIKSNLHRHTDKSDSYSFAITLWEMDTGSDIYPNIADANSLYSLLTSEKRADTTQCNPTIAYFIQAGWQTNPNDRPTADEYLKIMDEHACEFVQNNLPSMKL